MTTCTCLRSKKLAKKLVKKVKKVRFAPGSKLAANALEDALPRVAVSKKTSTSFLKKAKPVDTI